MKKQLAIIGLAALVVAGCGPSKAELEEQERQRQEAEQAAEREAKRRELDEELAQISRQIEESERRFAEITAESDRELELIKREGEEERYQHELEYLKKSEESALKYGQTEEAERFAAERRHLELMHELRENK